MVTFARSGRIDYPLIALSEEEFRKAFCTEHEVDGQRVWTIKALAGIPSYYVPENHKLLWPLPFEDIEVVFEDEP